MIKGPYIDKSMFIKELMDENNDVFFLTRPRGFGKTTNLNMLCKFLDLASDVDDSFRQLDIFQHESFCKMHFQQYPVIYLDFKDLKAENMKEFEDKILDLIKTNLENLSKFYKLDASLVDDIEKDVTQAPCFYLKDISEVLYFKFDKKCIILIDEYEMPLQHALKMVLKDYKNNRLFYNDLIEFFKSFYGSGFKGNNYLYKGLMSGTVKIPDKRLIDPSLNNVVDATIIDRYFNEKFGFTKNEITKFLPHFNIDKNVMNIDNMIKQYDGYFIGNPDHPQDRAKLFNPISVLLAIKTGNINENNWIKTSYHRDLIYLFQNSKLSDHDLNKLLNLVLNFDHSQTEIQANINDEIKDREKLSLNLNVLLLILLHSGYLTVLNSSGKSLLNLGIPNQEAIIGIRNLLSNIIESRLGVKYESLIKFLETFDLKSFKESFEKILFTSSLDSFKHNKDFYHILVLGLLISFGTKSLKQVSIREIKSKRYEVKLLNVKCNEESVFVIEYKIAESKDKMIETLNKTFNHIKDTYIPDKIMDKVFIAICFYKKDCLVDYKLYKK